MCFFGGGRRCHDPRARAPSVLAKWGPTSPRPPRHRRTRARWQPRPGRPRRRHQVEGPARRPARRRRPQADVRLQRASARSNSGAAATHGRAHRAAAPKPTTAMLRARAPIRLKPVVFTRFYAPARGLVALLLRWVQFPICARRDERFRSLGASRLKHGAHFRQISSCETGFPTERSPDGDEYRASAARRPERL